MKLFFIAIILLVIANTSFAENVNVITQEQLVALNSAPKSEKFVILDVRSAKEFNQGHIAGAMNIPHDEIEQRLAQLSGLEKKLVIVHCRSGRRAQHAESVLIENGFKKLHHLEGDFNAWQAANLPVVQN